MLQDRHTSSRTSAAPERVPRVFLLLQGPHGPFFDRLGRLLRASGAQVWRCAFNAGDEFFWSDPAHLLRHTGSGADWPAHLDRIIAEKGVTDIVLYGDVRPIHAAARMAAQVGNLRLHVFEEGYLRPFWISYERGGSNGHSALLDISLSEMRATLRDTTAEIRRPPAHWGDMRQHKAYGAFYHFLVLVANRRYRQFASHRSLLVFHEFRLNLVRLMLTPLHSLTRAVQWRRFRLSGHPYLLVPMQLEHDSNMLGHSPFARNRDFVERVIAEFARSAPRHQHLLFKAHPLEDGRARNRRSIREIPERHRVSDRVHYFRGGKLADMMAHARAIITVNSTAAQQALWRGLPVKALGRAVYCKPGLVSGQSLSDFLAHPQQPDTAAYRIFRNYLLQTSQVPGGFYSRRSRAHALRLVADLILAPEDPYQALASGRFHRRQQIGEVLD
ncbi:capsule biosynthesis protein [Paracoccus sp. SY]|uniref:capsule biosynthesis protein n=1 Tax=Paracoccus sp. SY TaxID=1330255 RepID=UPI000CD0E297|nr:capsule biosynthesis protein CapA [Paracoccus sp. SY]